MPETSDRTPEPAESHPASNSTALEHLVRRLRSQPMLLAVAVLLILASVASASIDRLRVLLPAALTIFIVAVVAWIIVELVGYWRGASAGDGEDVRVSARRVGRAGEVYGVDDQSDAPAAGSVKVRLDAEDIEGRVTGVRRGPRRP
jgi:hypothetical protein